MQLTSPLLDDHDSFYQWPIDGLNSRRICFIEYVMVYSPILISVDVGSGASGGCAPGVTVGNEVRGGGGVAVAGVVLEIGAGAGSGVVVAGVVFEIECGGGGVVVAGVGLESEGGGGVRGAGEERFPRA